jgi:hypothetical protein
VAYNFLASPTISVLESHLIKNSPILFLDLTKRRYDGELQRLKDLDGKANNMAGSLSVVIGAINWNTSVWSSRDSLLYSVLYRDRTIGFFILLLVAGHENQSFLLCSASPPPLPSNQN